MRSRFQNYRNNLGSALSTYRGNGEVLAVVEAKRTSRDVRVGQKQVEDYVIKIAKTQSFRPFAFMGNGTHILFWDSEESAPRHVAGFFSRDDLERQLIIKQNRIPLSTVQIKPSIVDSAYLVGAIRRISKTIELKKKRKALLVMTAGTGKTRTTMVPIDVFLQARAAQKVAVLYEEPFTNVGMDAIEKLFDKKAALGCHYCQNIKKILICLMRRRSNQF